MSQLLDTYQNDTWQLVSLRFFSLGDSGRDIWTVVSFGQGLCVHVVSV